MAWHYMPKSIDSFNSKLESTCLTLSSKATWSFLSNLSKLHVVIIVLRKRLTRTRYTTLTELEPTGDDPQRLVPNTQSKLSLLKPLYCL